MATSGLIGVTILVAVIYALVPADFGADHDKAVPEKIAATIAPRDSVGPTGAEAAAHSVATVSALTTTEGPGLAVYNKACMACHDSGAADAPRLGDRAAWEPRMAQGLDRLLQIVIAGKGIMPPRGACMDCRDDDLKAAIGYMLAQAGYAPAASSMAGDVRSADAMSGTEGISGMEGASSRESEPALR